MCILLPFCTAITTYFSFFVVQAEKWVSNMTKTTDDNSTRVVLEARPPGLVL